MKKLRRLLGLDSNEHHTLESEDMKEDLERMKRESFIISKIDRSERLYAFGASSKSTASNRRPKSRNIAKTPNPFVTRL